MRSSCLQFGLIVGRRSRGGKRLLRNSPRSGASSAGLRVKRSATFAASSVPLAFRRNRVVSSRSREPANALACAARLDAGERRRAAPE